jgi:hypothetical protein
MKHTQDGWGINRNQKDGVFVYASPNADWPNGVQTVIAKILPAANPNEQYANATLIWAAPEMLRILKMVRDKAELSEDLAFWVNNAITWADLSEQFPAEV